MGLQAQSHLRRQGEQGRTKGNQPKLGCPGKAAWMRWTFSWTSEDRQDPGSRRRALRRGGSGGPGAKQQRKWCSGEGQEGEEQIMEFEVEPAGSGEPVAVLQGSEGLWQLP